MKWPALLEKVGEEPVFKTSTLVSGDVKLPVLRLQLSRWVRDGRLLQLRKGVYTIAKPYGKVPPEPLYLANVLKSASYVSLESALAHYGMIPEHVSTVTSVTTGRPENLETPLGTFIFRHVKKGWFFGFQRVQLISGQDALLAQPEKALLDLIYLNPAGDEKSYLEQLRLQNLGRIDVHKLKQWANDSGRPKLKRAVELVADLAAQGEGELL